MPIPYWRLSGFYALYFATLGGFMPFWSLYLEARHFDAASIGELSALLIGTKIIAPNIWGWIADYSGRTLRIIRLTSFLASLGFVGFLFVNDYFGFAVVTLLFSFFWNAALPQYEALTLAHLKSEPHRYAQIRLWGSFGFIVAVLGIGGLLKQYSITLLPIILAGALMLTWFMSLLTPDIKTISHADSKPGIWKLLLRAEVIAFFVVYLLLQISHGPYYVFYSIYLKQHNYSELMTGFLWSLGVCAEIIIFIAAQPLLKVFTLRSMLLGSLLLSLIRWYLIADFADNLWIMLFAQLLHAASFGTTHLIAVQLVQAYFGNAHPGKGQALYSSISFGIGGMLGGYYSGYLWQVAGPETVFKLASLCCTLGLLIAYLWVARGKP